MFLENLKNLDLKGFTLSANPAADHLEQALGITFLQKPSRIDLNWKNRLVLSRKTNLWIRFWALRNKWGAYINNSNTIFISGDPPELVPTHENMHGYQVQLNPKLRHHGELAVAIQHRLEERDIGNYDPEKEIVQHCFSEGMCHWAAALTAHSLPNIYDTHKATEFIESYVLDQFREKGHKDEGFDQYIKRRFDALEEGINLVRNSLVSNGQETYRLASMGLGITNNLTYASGYDFVKRAMDQLRANGVKTNIGIDMLIKNPPTLTEELRNGARYVRGLRYKR